MTEDKELTNALSHKYAVPFNNYSPSYRVASYLVTEISGDEVLGQQEVLGLDRTAKSSAIEECIRAIFEGGRQLTSDVVVTEYREYETRPYDHQELIEARGREARQQVAECERLKKIDTWIEAIDWAREHGAQIRRGKISKDLAYYRIYSAGLMEEFSEKFPTFAFDLDRVRAGVERLKEKDEYYREKHERWEARQKAMVRKKKAEEKFRI